METSDYRHGLVDVNILNWLRWVDLNHRPPDYESVELPGCSTARGRAYAGKIAGVNSMQVAIGARERPRRY